MPVSRKRNSFLPQACKAARIGKNRRNFIGLSAPVHPQNRRTAANSIGRAEQAAEGAAGYGAKGLPRIAAHAPAIAAFGLFFPP